VNDHRRACRGCKGKLAQHVGRGANVESAHWIVGDDKLRVVVKFAREHELLLVSSGQITDSGVRGRRPHVVRLHHARGLRT
jgi:hypothetical protein